MLSFGPAAELVCICARHDRLDPFGLAGLLDALHGETAYGEIDARLQNAHGLPRPDGLLPVRALFPRSQSPVAAVRPGRRGTFLAFVRLRNISLLMRFTGTLKTWNDERGFGFIDPTQGGQELFVHIKDFPSGTGRPSVGQTLTFEVESGPNGKKKARAVQYPVRSRRVGRPRVESPAPWTLPRVLAIPLFAAVYVFVAWRWGFSPVVLLVYLGLSLVAFIAYAIDKSAAVTGRWRTAEQTLHLFSLAGGWPGALLAQQVLRHKTSKQSFIAAFWLTVLLNVGAFVACHAGLLPLPRPGAA